MAKEKKPSKAEIRLREMELKINSHDYNIKYLRRWKDEREEDEEERSEKFWNRVFFVFMGIVLFAGARL